MVFWSAEGVTYEQYAKYKFSCEYNLSKHKGIPPYFNKDMFPVLETDIFEISLMLLSMVNLSGNWPTVLAFVFFVNLGEHLCV